MKKILLFIASVFIAISVGNVSAYASQRINEKSESNDTASEAQEIERNNIDKSSVTTGKYNGQNVISGNIDDASDVDWYKVYLPADNNTIFAINSPKLSGKIEILDENLNIVKGFTHRQNTNMRGATPYRVPINKSGTYYVKIYSIVGGGDYLFTIGGPNYSVDSYTYKPSSKMTLTTSIKSTQMDFDLSKVSTIPDGAVVYDVTFQGTRTNSASNERRSLKLASDYSWIATSSYTFTAKVPVVRNMLLKSNWNAKLEGDVSRYTKTYSLSPSIRFDYVYPQLP